MINNDLELFEINLQLFAEGEEDSTTDGEEGGGGETTDDVDTEDTDLDTAGEEDLTSTKNENVPLGKFLEEKKRRRELEKQVREFQEKNSSQESLDKLEKIKNLAKSKGYDDDFADLMAEVSKEMLSSVTKVDREEREILEDIQDLSEEYPEAVKYKKEIVEKIKKYRKVDPDFGVEDALNLIKPSKIRTNELKTDIEQKQAIARRNVESKKVANSTSSAPNNPYPLDEADKKALEGLQKAQPNSNWTVKKYWERKNS
jgi:hypothetical protein